MENANRQVENNGMVTSNVTSNASCSACKYQRKKCRPDCILRKHFPGNMGDQEFKNVQKIFGISNITKKIKEANNSVEAERAVVESLLWEGKAWANDPVNGPYGEFRALQQVLKAGEQELNEVKCKLQIMQAYIEESSFPNAMTNRMNVNVTYPNHTGLFMDAYARNGFQQLLLQHENNNGLNDQRIMMENENWRELHSNGSQQWREQGNIGPSSLGHNTHTTLLSDTEKNRIQDFGSEKPN